MLSTRFSDCGASSRTTGAWLLVKLRAAHYAAEAKPQASSGQTQVKSQSSQDSQTRACSQSSQGRMVEWILTKE
jgi:hypothetical protein